MSLDQYLKSFSRLRTYKDRKKWSALTNYQAPRKPFLLLAIMDLIVQGSITENFIEPSFEFIETFSQKYFMKFYHQQLKSELIYRLWT